MCLLDVKDFSILQLDIMVAVRLGGNDTYPISFYFYFTNILCCSEQLLNLIEC